MENNLKALRLAANLTQQQLGNMCAPPLKHVYISRYENGKVAMSGHILIKLSNALNLTPSALLGYGEVIESNTTPATTSMYFDVTREELLELLADYEQGSSLRSLAIKAGISYVALIDFKRGKSTMLGDKNLRAIMRFLRPQPIQAHSSTITIRYAAEWAMEYVETLPASARRHLTARKFGEFVALVCEVLNEQAAKQAGKLERLSPLVMDAILSKASHLNQ